METYTVSVFGHRKIENSISVEAEMEKLVIALLQSKPYVEFLVGRNGDFDILAASVIRRCNTSLSAMLRRFPAERRIPQDLICQPSGGYAFGMPL